MLIPTIVYSYFIIQWKNHRNGRTNKTKLNFCKDENEVDFYKYGYLIYYLKWGLKETLSCIGVSINIIF